MILIKLGGSVLTDKEEPYSFKTRIAKRLLKEIDESSVDEYIIIHGGGSFGHPGAKKYNLNEKEPKRSIEGLSKVQLDMRRMNNRILELMHNQNMWGVSIPGGLVTTFEDGNLEETNIDIFKRYLSLGAVPVGFGDVAMDTEREVTICSGDDLILGLSSLADKAVFVTDVDGIYKEGDLVKTFERDMLPLKEDDFSRTEKTVDVTGGMNKKVEKIFNISEECETHIVNGEKVGRLRKILDNEKVISTQVK
ncbi:MAG: isopentenyl phosphate kinase [Candidatus Thermoplasmatota archaeon]